MLKCKTAQDWVDAAIACGMDPHIVPGPVDRNGVPAPGKPTRMLCTSLRGARFGRLFYHSASTGPEAY
jgi:hypothetical protein